MTQPEPTQRREFYRIDCQIELSLEVPESSRRVPATCVSLAGGGMRVLLNEKLRADSRIECELPLPEGDLRVFGHVVRSAPCRDHSIEYRFEAGIAFDHPDESVEDRLVRLIMDLERVLIQSGKHPSKAT